MQTRFIDSLDSTVGQADPSVAAGQRPATTELRLASREPAGEFAPPRWIGTVIWTVAGICLVAAAVLWWLLLRGLPS